MSAYRSKGKADSDPLQLPRRLLQILGIRLAVAGRSIQAAMSEKSSSRYQVNIWVAHKAGCYIL